MNSLIWVVLCSQPDTDWPEVIGPFETLDEAEVWSLTHRYNDCKHWEKPVTGAEE